MIQRKKVTLISKKACLDRIENSLIHSDFIENRKFISMQLPDTFIDSDAIEPLYKEKIPNMYCDIAKEFKRIKTVANKAKNRIEEILSLYNSLIAETDPLVGYDIIEEIAYNCRDGFRNWSISLPDDMDDEDFLHTIKVHKKLYETLKLEGLLDAIHVNEELLYLQISEFLAMNSWTPDDVNEIKITLKSNCVEIHEIDNRKITATKYFDIEPQKNEYGNQVIPDHRMTKFIDSTHLKTFWLPGRSVFQEGKHIDDKGISNDRNLSIYKEIQYNILMKKYQDIVDKF